MCGTAQSCAATGQTCDLPNNQCLCGGSPCPTGESCMTGACMCGGNPSCVGNAAADACDGTDCKCGGMAVCMGLTPTCTAAMCV